MDESITRAAGAIHGQEMPPERMVALIKSVNRIPQQRTTLYTTPKEKIFKKSYGFLGVQQDRLVQAIKAHI